MVHPIHPYKDNRPCENNRPCKDNRPFLKILS